MSALLPRLDPQQTTAQLDVARALSLTELTARMPVTDVTTTSSPLGGLELGEEALGDLRASVLALARKHGFPSEKADLPLFDAHCARLVHDLLRLSPHEASEDDVWSHLTCCWLLDIAAWRWGGIGASDRRFRGDVNRNTFRRLWWRVLLGAVFCALLLILHEPLLGVSPHIPLQSRPRRWRGLSPKVMTSTPLSPPTTSWRSQRGTCCDRLAFAFPKACA